MDNMKTSKPSKPRTPKTSDQTNQPKQPAKDLQAPGPGQNQSEGKQIQTVEAEKRVPAEKDQEQTKESDKTLPICKASAPNDTESSPEEKSPAPDWKGPIGRRTLTGRPRKFKTPQELLDKAAEYIESLCDADGHLTQPITISGMCNYIGTYRQRLFEYENGSLEGLKDGNGDDAGFRDAIKRMKSICEEYAENHMFTARNPAGAIFALKNYGWKDTQTIETTTTEIHTIDAGTRELLQGYMNQLAQAQRMTVVDITPAPDRELVPVDNRQLSTEIPRE